MRDMPQKDAEKMLKASRFGVLALADESGAYAIPLFYGFDGEAVYFHCHPGLKDHFLDETKTACLNVVHEENEDIWESVQVFGPVERLHITDDIKAAKSSLFRVPFPPEEGSFPRGTPKRTDSNIFYVRLRPERIAGKASRYETRIERVA